MPCLLFSSDALPKAEPRLHGRRAARGNPRQSLPSLRARLRRTGKVQSCSPTPRK